ncbi:hypothetical protein B0H11DRAFT_2257606 [Mycena galericulata]|nr:hypothetical protein B0H11DRAFT_2257606 [Mycena galericulata]
MNRHPTLHQRMEAVIDLATRLLAQPDRRARGQTGAGRRGLPHVVCVRSRLPDWAACDLWPAALGHRLAYLSPVNVREPSRACRSTARENARDVARKHSVPEGAVQVQLQEIVVSPTRQDAYTPQRLQLDLFTRPRPNAEYTYTPTQSERLLTHAAPPPPPTPLPACMRAGAHSASFPAPAQRLAQVCAASLGVPRGDV